MKKKKLLLSIALASVCLFSLLPSFYTNREAVSEKVERAFVCENDIYRNSILIKTYKSPKYHSSLSLNFF